MKIKIKTAELTGALLDQAVATAEGWSRADDDPSAWEAPAGHPSWPCTSITERGIMHGYGYHPAHNWAHGGPIIERSRIYVGPRVDLPGRWDAHIDTVFGGTHHHAGFGPTPLIAAMRAFVASKVGDEVEL